MLVVICQNIQITDSNSSIDSNYWIEEEMAMATLYLYYMNN